MTLADYVNFPRGWLIDALRRLNRVADAWRHKRYVLSHHHHLKARLTTLCERLKSLFQNQFIYFLSSVRTIDALCSLDRKVQPVCLFVFRPTIKTLSWLIWWAICRSRKAQICTSRPRYRYRALPSTATASISNPSSILVSFFCQQPLHGIAATTILLPPLTVAKIQHLLSWLTLCSALVAQLVVWWMSRPIQTTQLTRHPGILVPKRSPRIWLLSLYGLLPNDPRQVHLEKD